MNYELKFYYGNSNNDVQFLGAYALADDYTYNHYLQLTSFKIEFSVWFNHYDNVFIHRNVIVDRNTICVEGTTDNGDTKAIYIISNDLSKIKFLTEEQFRNQNKINELINQIAKEDIRRFLK
jgi:hypothetical protein